MGGGPKASAANLEPLGKRRVFGAQAETLKSTELTTPASETREVGGAGNIVPALPKPTGSRNVKDPNAGNSPVQLPSPPSTTKSITGMDRPNAIKTPVAQPKVNRMPSPRTRLANSAKALAAAQEWQAKINALSKKRSTPDSQGEPDDRQHPTHPPNMQDTQFQPQSQQPSASKDDFKIRGIAAAPTATEEPSPKRRKCGQGSRASAANLEPLGKRRQGFSPKPSTDAKLPSPEPLQQQLPPQPSASQQPESTPIQRLDTKNDASAKGQPQSQPYVPPATVPATPPAGRVEVTRVNPSNSRTGHDTVTTSKRDPSKSHATDERRSCKEHLEVTRPTQDRPDHHHRSTYGPDHAHSSRGYAGAEKPYRRKDTSRNFDRSRSPRRVPNHPPTHYRDDSNMKAHPRGHASDGDKHSTDRYPMDKFRAYPKDRDEAYHRETYPRHTSSGDQRRGPDPGHHRNAINSSGQYFQHDGYRDRRYDSDTLKEHDTRRDRSPMQRRHRNRSASPRRTRYEGRSGLGHGDPREGHRRFGDDHSRDYDLRRHDGQEYRRHESHNPYDEKARPARRYDNDQGHHYRSRSPYSHHRHNGYPSYDGYSREDDMERYRDGYHRARDPCRR